MLPVLCQGMILPRTEKKAAGKNRKAIKQALADLRDEHSDGGSAVVLQSLIEQACNFYLKRGCFPDTYEEMQAIPVLKVGVLALCRRRWRRKRASISASPRSWRGAAASLRSGSQMSQVSGRVRGLSRRLCCHCLIL